MQRELNTTLTAAGFDMIGQSAFSVRGVGRSGQIVAHTSWGLPDNDTMIDVDYINTSQGAPELDDYTADEATIDRIASYSPESAHYMCASKTSGGAPILADVSVCVSKLTH